MNSQLDTRDLTYIECSCCSEGLQVDYDKEDRFTYLSIYYIGKPSKRDLWTRIKWAWKVLWTGEAYNDQLILNEVEVERLLDKLFKIKVHQNTFNN
jgi:hypothetical protein